MNLLILCIIQMEKVILKRLIIQKIKVKILIKLLIKVYINTK